MFPVNNGYSIQKIFYKTYHAFNHVNLFGSSYVMQEENMIESLLAEVSG